MALTDVKTEHEKYLNRENCFQMLANRNNQIDILKVMLKADSARLAGKTAAQLQTALGITLAQAETLVAYGIACSNIIAAIDVEITAERLIDGQIKAEPIFA